MTDDFHNLPNGQLGIRLTYDTESKQLEFSASGTIDRFTTFGMIERAKQLKRSLTHKHLPTVRDTQIGILVLTTEFGTPEEETILAIAGKASDVEVLGILHAGMIGIQSKFQMTAQGPAVQKRGGLILPNHMRM